MSTLKKDPTRRATPLPSASPLRIPPGQILVLFRSLATLTQAGVMIHEGLGVLALSSADKESKEVLDGLSQAVLKGEPLSRAMDRYPNAFAPYLRAAVKVGEKTGRMVHVLDTLSRDLEKAQRLVYRMRSALFYPAFLFSACGLLMLLGPPYLLAGQLKILSESGQPMPFLTQILIFMADLMQHPGFIFLLLLGLAVPAWWALSPTGRRSLRSWAVLLPIFNRFMKTISLATFCRSFSLQLRAGVTAFEAIRNAHQDGAYLEISVALKQTEKALLEGLSLRDSFAESGYFSIAFLSFIEVGENSGTLVKLTTWLADFYESELESDLDRFVGLAEPVLMVAMGAFTALLLVATLQPTIAVLQTL